jgi:hypothetical protein
LGDPEWLSFPDPYGSKVGRDGFRGPGSDRDSDPQLVRERVECGKRGCRCTRGVRHGPYWYLRYEEWDRVAVRYRREYVPKDQVKRVRRWIRYHRAQHASVRALLFSSRGLSLTFGDSWTRLRLTVGVAARLRRLDRHCDDLSAVGK